MISSDATPPDGTSQPPLPGPPPLPEQPPKLPPPKRTRTEVVLAAIAGGISIVVMLLLAFDVDVCGMARAAGVTLDACRERIGVPTAPAAPPTPASSSTPPAPDAARDGGAR